MFYCPAIVRTAVRGSVGSPAATCSMNVAPCCVGDEGSVARKVDGWTTAGLNIKLNSLLPATFYSYDPHGNVDTLLQDYGGSSVMSGSNRYKLLKYDYDLVSGKVNQVSYQPGWADGFYHQYSYDAENRITNVRTSTDSVAWQNDAAYTYYRHGPLARAQLGDLQVQGIDYAYTVQGWLKSINPSAITPTGSVDQFDADGTSSPALFERDAYKLNLNYFDDGTYTDYTPIAPVSGYVQGNQLLSGAKNNLYNGNISSMAINIRALGPIGGKRDVGPMLYNYKYDQLNRIGSMDAWAADGTFKPINTMALTDFAERYTYDPNGNIMSLNRNGDTANQSMDQLTYKYIYAKTGGAGNGEYVPGSAPTSGVDHLTNQLSSITDAVTGNSYAGDIKKQPSFNYRYDAIGELVYDSAQKLSNMVWNVYGKLLCLKDSGNTISFTYDAAGNRISKTAHGITTWYVRDAQGNVMSVYTQGNSAINSGSLTQSEDDLYGSSRLGLLNLSVNCGVSLTKPVSGSLVRGGKLFELSNHLGNVLATISDKKLQHTTDNTTVDYYTADVINANDYYAFGMGMPSRSFTVASSGNYRYGFNGKENDNEVKGVGDQIDYGMRVYDPRAGRFLSVDPISKKYPELTPYQYASNRPIDGIDQDGKEWELNKEAITLQHQAEAVKPGLGLPKPYFLTADVYGRAVIGHESDVRAEVGVAWAQNFEHVGQNIANGPGGAIGFLVGGVRGSDIGASFDGIALSLGGIPDQNSSVLSKPKNSLDVNNVAENRANPEAPVDIFNIKPEKYRYFFGRVTSGDPHNVQRSAQNLKDLNTLGIKDPSQLLETVRLAYDSKDVISTKSSEHGTTVMKRILINDQGSINVGFFYKDGDMTQRPSVTTIIPKIYPKK
jgi:RHS repeat-associated protein